MFALKPGLAALALLPVPFVVLTAMRYSRRSRPAVQEIQQRIAELTAEAEESISGIRIVKAFAREGTCSSASAARWAGSSTRTIYSTRLQAFYSPLIGFLPSLGLAVVLLVGGRQVIDGTLSLGDFTAFYTYLMMLIGPMRMLGIAARDGPARGRLGQPAVRDPRPRAADREPAGRAAAARRARAGSSCAASRSPTTAARPRWRTSSSRSRPDGRSRSSGPTGSGKTSLVALLARLYDPTGARS